jgi:hypothetical protein
LNTDTWSRDSCANDHIHLSVGFGGRFRVGKESEQRVLRDASQSCLADRSRTGYWNRQCCLAVDDAVHPPANSVYEESASKPSKHMSPEHVPPT